MLFQYFVTEVLMKAETELLGKPPELGLNTNLDFDTRIFSWMYKERLLDFNVFNWTTFCFLNYLSVQSTIKKKKKKVTKGRNIAFLHPMYDKGKTS